MTTAALAAGNVCRAWVNFDGTSAGTFAGGTSTVTRIAGSTTATITTTTAHNLVTGNYVYAATGVVAGAYAVTVLTSTTFTITTVATTALTAASITFNFALIRGAGNVNSVAIAGTGNLFVNFTTAIPDANYSVGGTARGTSGNTNGGGLVLKNANVITVNTVQVGTIGFGATSIATTDQSEVCVQIFR